MSDSRERFEEWAKGEGIDCSTSDSGHFHWLSTEKLWQGWSARDSEVERLREALQTLLTMLPSDHPERPDAERIPLSYCYVRWQDIRAARALLSSQDKESA